MKVLGWFSDLNVKAKKTMDPRNRNIWDSEEDSEEENLGSDDDSSDEEEEDERSLRGLTNEEEEEEEEEEGFAEEYDEEEENNLDDDEEDDDDEMEGYNGITPHQQLEQQQQQGHHIHPPLLNGSSQTETTSSGEDGRHYYMENGDGMYAERLSEQVGVGGEDEFEYPTEEMIKTGNYVSGYIENGMEEELLGRDRDAEKMVSITPKGPGKSGPQKRKSLASMGAFGESSASATKKAKKKNTNVWAKSSSRKGGKKNRASNGTIAAEDTVNITPVVRVPDKVDDSPDLRICLSKIYKAEKVELSDDRLTASSTKGYRMVRANRGVVEGAWYFEIKVVHLGKTGHTRLGWSTEKGDVQAPVGYDANSYSYRDLEGSKVHKAVREPYGDAYVEGDVIGFYINLPNGSEYAPKPPQYAWHKNQLYYYNNPEETPKMVPGSEILFFRNGKCQGIAFKDIIAGRYYPAASMYTLPNESPSRVQFNFGPEFDCFPEDFGEHSLPMPMYDAPYCGINGREIERGEPLVENGQISEKKT